MAPREIMVVAGETSGDLLAADLVRALRKALAAADHDGSAGQPLRASLEARFFGAGGPALAAAGMELLFDMTEHAVVGLSDALRKIFTFRQLMGRLVEAAVARQPAVIVCVDFSGFNLRLAAAIRRQVRKGRGVFRNWNPKIVQLVSPQVWASRAGRAKQLARNVDLLLSIFPFEKDWYAKRAPGLRVEFVGHPIVDRYAGMKGEVARREGLVALLPGSRVGELRRHVGVMGEAARLIGSDYEKAMVLPNAGLAELAEGLLPAECGVRVQVGGLAEVLREATVAIAATGTVTMECAYFCVPTVAMYRTSRLTYEVGRRIIQVPYLAMPNLLAGEELFPEFVQGAATGERLADAALGLLRDEAKQKAVRGKLRGVMAGLGGPGAMERAAKAIVEVMR